MDSYKKSKNESPAINEQLSSLDNTTEDQQPQCVSFFLQLFQLSKTNFENKDLDALNKNFIDIVDLIEKGGLLCIIEETLIQYSTDLIEIIEQLQNNPDQQRTIYYGLRIILYIFYVNNSIMDYIIKNGNLPFFQNLMQLPDKYIREAATYISVLFYSSPDLLPIVLNSTLFSDLCGVFQFYLEAQDPNENIPILMVVSNAFNGIAKNYKYDDNVTLATIEKIIELYSISFQGNFETKLITRFIEFLQILKLKMDRSIISLLFEYNLPSEFYEILYNSESFKTQSLYFFSFLTAFMEEVDYSLMSQFFDFGSFLNLLAESKDSSLFSQYYAFLIIENSLKFDEGLLNMVADDQFLIFVTKCLDNGRFGVRYRAGRCLLSALNAASLGSLHIVEKFFSTDIMLTVLDILETDESELIIQALKNLDCLMSRLNDLVETDKMEFYPAFREKFLDFMESLLNSPNEDIKILTDEILIKHFGGESEQPDND